MKIAGVRLSSGRMAWLDVGRCDPQSGEMVRVRIGDEDETGRTVVAPGNLLRLPQSTNGEILEILRPDEKDAGMEIPLANLPPLGTTLQTPLGPGMVTALEPVDGIVSVTYGNGNVRRYKADELQKRRVDDG